MTAVVRRVLISAVSLLAIACGGSAGPAGTGAAGGAGSGGDHGQSPAPQGFGDRLAALDTGDPASLDQANALFAEEYRGAPPARVIDGFAELGVFYNRVIAAAMTTLAEDPDLGAVLCSRAQSCDPDAGSPRAETAALVDALTGRGVRIVHVGEGEYDLAIDELWLVERHQALLPAAEVEFYRAARETEERIVYAEGVFDGDVSVFGPVLARWEKLAAEHPVPVRAAAADSRAAETMRQFLQLCEHGVNQARPCEPVQPPLRKAYADFVGRYPDSRYRPVVQAFMTRLAESKNRLPGEELQRAVEDAMRQVLPR